MSNPEGAVSAPDLLPVSEAIAARAAGALASIVGAGAKILVREPWRVSRIVRRAETMTIFELSAHVAARRRAGTPADLNLGIGLAQLNLALKTPGFAAAWAAWRSIRSAG